MIHRKNGQPADPAELEQRPWNYILGIEYSMYLRLVHVGTENRTERQRQKEYVSAYIVNPAARARR